MTDSHDLEIILKSHIPIVVIETREERRAVQLIQTLQFKLGVPIFKWTVSLLIIESLPMIHSLPSVIGRSILDFPLKSIG